MTTKASKQAKLTRIFLCPLSPSLSYGSVIGTLEFKDSTTIKAAVAYTQLLTTFIDSSSPLPEGVEGDQNNVYLHAPRLFPIVVYVCYSGWTFAQCETFQAVLRALCTLGLAELVAE